MPPPTFKTHSYGTRVRNKEMEFFRPYGTYMFRGAVAMHSFYHLSFKIVVTSSVVPT